MKKSGSQQLLAKQRLPRASVRLHGLGECLLLHGSGFLPAGAQIGGLALPRGACRTASLPFGRRSLSAARGAAARGGWPGAAGRPRPAAACVHRCRAAGCGGGRLSAYEVTSGRPFGSENLLITAFTIRAPAGILQACA